MWKRDLAGGEADPCDSSPCTSSSPPEATQQELQILSLPEVEASQLNEEEINRIQVA